MWEGLNLKDCDCNTFLPVKLFPLFFSSLRTQFLSYVLNQWTKRLKLFIWLFSPVTHTHTHTHTYIYIYIYILVYFWRGKGIFKIMTQLKRKKEVAIISNQQSRSKERVARKNGKGNFLKQSLSILKNVPKAVNLWNNSGRVRSLFKGLRHSIFLLHLVRYRNLSESYWCLDQSILNGQHIGIE